MQQQPNSFRRFIKRNSYLPVAAAWLFTLSFLIDNYWLGNSTVKEVQQQLQQYVHTQERAFDQLLTDTVSLKKISNNSYSENDLQRLTEHKFFLFRYALNEVGQSHLLFWNTQTVIPNSAIIEDPALSGFSHLQNGYYVWRKSGGKGFVTIALIPVKWSFFVTNEYLKNSFATGSGLENNFDIALKPGINMVNSVSGNALFSVEKKTSLLLVKNNWVSVTLRLIGMLILLLFVHLIATWLVHFRNLWKAIGFLTLAILLLRITSYFFPIPLNLRQFELFDPAVYGANVILRSLGDLLINSILFAWLVLFIRHHLQDSEFQIPQKKSFTRWWFLALATLIYLATSFMFADIIRSMVSDSQISFDVINFFTLNQYSVIGFVVLCCIAIGYFVLSQILLLLLRPLFPLSIMVLYLSVAIGGLVYLSLFLTAGNAAFEIFVLFWLLLFLLLLNSNLLNLLTSRISSSRMVFWIFFFSITITVVVVGENQKKELRNRKHYAETLSTKGDPASETLMNTMLTDFRNEFLLANFDRFKTDSINRQLKDSLIRGNFSGYTNKYETKIYSFDALEQPLYNLDSTSFNELNTVLNTQAKPTGISDLYYYDESYDRFSYISRKNVTDTYDSLLGYVFILANPKKNKSETLYPELFSKGHNNAIENSSIYAFATYNNLQLASSHNDYPFATRLNKQQVPLDEFVTYKVKNFDELWYKAGPQKMVIIVKEDNIAIEAITLFSYLFCAFLLVTLVFWLLNVFIRSGLNRKRLKEYWQLSIRNQIHGTIIFISVLSFLVIGAATILFFINRYQNNNRERLSLAIHVMGNEVRTAMSDLSVFDDVVKVYDEGYREKLEKILIKISEIHAFDINLYDLDGNLQVSSLALPYQKGIVSTKMDPQAYYHLSKLKEVQYFKEERIGKLNYVSNYVPVIDETGKEYAYLNIPHFTSQSKLRSEISYFLVTIINLNAFIFLIAGIVAMFLTNRITRSFSFISDKMKAVNLGQLNEAINWNRKDEIGELVKEYNKMVGKLDASAAALAKSEREGAWREMARQVAHEIKNPLTPMKLSLQYLQKAISNKSDNVKELTANVAQTLVEQIDHLNQIAGEFSQFANIGNPHNEVFDLHESLRSITQLHSMEENLQLEWHPLSMELKIFADRTHINRLFTNLFQNALQSVAEGRTAEIIIDEILLEGFVQIRVKDNGNGIPEEMQSKIFTPNFTTKTSGTGLGLAMCKGIVEQAKGEIWFETSLGAGTSFFVKLPLC